jgi:predicted nucleotidyltransferase
MKEYNIKKFYRFIEFTSILCGIDLCHEQFKRISLGYEKPINEYQKKVKRFADSYNYLLNNISSIFDEQLIKSVYYLLASEELSKKNIITILKVFYENLEFGIAERILEIKKAIISINTKNCVQFSMMIVNYILIKNKYEPIILYRNDHKVYWSLDFSSNKELYGFLLDRIYRRKKMMQKATKKIDKLDVISQLKNQRNLIVKEYKVSSLYLYGSIVKDLHNSESDVDFLISFSDDLIPFEVVVLKEKVKSYLGKLCMYEIDLIDFNEAIVNLETYEMENIIKII